MLGLLLLFSGPMTDPCSQRLDRSMRVCPPCPLPWLLGLHISFIYFRLFFDLFGPVHGVFVIFRSLGLPPSFILFIRWELSDLLLCVRISDFNSHAIRGLRSVHAILVFGGPQRVCLAQLWLLSHRQVQFEHNTAFLVFRLVHGRLGWGVSICLEYLYYWVNHSLIIPNQWLDRFPPHPHHRTAPVP